MHGWRETMEDAHCIMLSVGAHPRSAFFGIFDGHSGSLCSKYVAEKLPQNVANAKKLDDEAELRDIVLTTDEDFLTSVEYRTRDDGSAAIFTVVLYDDEKKTYKLINGNVGDSRTVLAKKEGNSYTAITCTHDHKPTDEAERRRIEAAGGTVQLSRVDGQLALSRAFGDRMLKVPQQGCARENRKVSANPDFITVNAVPGDFLFMACDGIYEGDIFTRESVIQWLSDKLKEIGDPSIVCGKLLEECLARGSRDNMSAVIIMFENGTSYHSDQNQYIPGPYYNGENDHKFQEAYLQDARTAGYSLPQALQLFEKMSREAKEKEEESKGGGGGGGGEPKSDATTSTDHVDTTN